MKEHHLADAVLTVILVIIVVVIVIRIVILVIIVVDGLHHYVYHGAVTVDCRSYIELI